MKNTPQEDTAFSSPFEHLQGEFLRREQERATVRVKLEAILRATEAAESECAQLVVFGTEERYRLARARVEVLAALRSLDRDAKSPEERTLRAVESFKKRNQVDG